MSMMRRGPLDRYSPDWVLRQANAHGIHGSIEFHTDRPLTFYLQDGCIYAAVEGTGATAGAPDAMPAEEAAARRHVVDLLSDALSREVGWYYLDPLGHVPTKGTWVWETAGLIMDTRAHAHEVRTRSTWSERTIELQPSPSGSVTLGSDAWSVVAALAGKRDTSALRSELDWSADRLIAALTEIEGQRVLADPSSSHHIGPPTPPVDPSPPEPPGRLLRRRGEARRAGG